MFSLLFSFLLGCVAAEDTAKIEQDTIVIEESPIYWDECSYRIGEHICNVSLTDSDLNQFELYEYYGRPIVIQLAAEWCAPCHVAGSHAEAIMAQWAEEDLLWVTILLENTDREWVAAMGSVNSIVLAGSGDLIDMSAMNGFPLTSWPTFVVINDDMLIYHGFAGWSEDYLNQKITEMLFNGG